MVVEHGQIKTSTDLTAQSHDMDNSHSVSVDLVYNRENKLAVERRLMQ